jgi:DNA-binding GntR family transcriptional regulator
MTSHAPVREAFRRLEARGLLVSRERRGTYVPLLDQESILEITRMRVVLEELALRHAIPNFTREDFICVRTAIEQARDCDDISTWEEANRRFHAGLYQPCGMTRLLANIESLHEARLRYMYATATKIKWDSKSEREHRRILKAVKAGDIESACALLRSHIGDSGEILVAAMRTRD